MKTSAQKATVGRIVHVRSGAWKGAMPAMVTNDASFTTKSYVEGSAQVADVNLFVHAVKYPGVLAAFRGRPEGNTLIGLPVFDPLTDDEREQLRLKGERVQLAHGDPTRPEVSVWCEWPPRN